MAAQKKTAKNDKTAKIAALLKQLESAKLQREKKMIRRSLRALGHEGGLRKAK
jgi:hypothetical protein